MKSSSNRFNQITLKVLSLLAVIALLHFTFKGQVQHIFAELKTLSPTPIAIALLFFGLSIAITLYRWSVLLRLQQVKLLFKEIFILHMAGFFFNTTTPGAVSGDFLKIATVMRRDPENKIPAIMTIFMDRVIGLISLLIIVLILVLPCAEIIWADGSDYLRSAVFIVSLAAFVALICVVLFIFKEKISTLKIVKFITHLLQKKLPKLFTLLQEVFTSIDNYRKYWQTTLGLVGISIISHLFLGLSFYFVGISLNVESNPLLFILSIQVSNVLAAVLPLPGGIGIRDAIGKAFMLALGCTATQAAAIPLLYTAIILFWALIGALIFIYWRISPKIKKT